MGPRECQSHDRHARAGLCRVRVHRAIEQDRTHHPRTLLRASGRRERQDQASSRIGQPGWGCSRRFPQWARRLQGSIGTQGINWPEVIGSIRGRYFILTRQVLDAQTAKDWGVVNEILPADRLLARAHEIADTIAALAPLTSRYTPIALTPKLRRLNADGSRYSLALQGLSAAVLSA